MIFRITDYVHYGTLDNRERGTVRLTLQLMGMPHPVNITLQGDCLQDLAGCVVDFRNPSPQTLPAELTQIPEHIQGVAGDMTASRRMPVKGRKTMENALYLEWFTSHHDMVLLESTVFSIKVSLPEWIMDSCEEQAQIMANQQMLRTQVKEWSRAYSNHQEDGSLPDHHWDKRLREAEAIAIAYQEVFQKYRLNPSGDIRVAFVMGWDEVLDNIAQSEETGTPCSCKSALENRKFSAVLVERSSRTQRTPSSPPRPLNARYMASASETASPVPWPPESTTGTPECVSR